MVRMEPDGNVRVAIGDPASGQGYETVIAQIVADELGLVPEAVSVARGFDSSDVAVALSLRQLLEQVLRHRRGRDRGRGPPRRGQAAPARRAPARDRPGRSRPARRRRGGAGSAGPARRLRRALPHRLRRRAGIAPGEAPGSRLITPTRIRSPPLSMPTRRVRSQLVFSNAAHCCLVEVHPRTGAVTVLKYVVVHDCGRELNPLIVEGMVHGSTVHGIGAALLEEFRYDEQGQLLTVHLPRLPEAHGHRRARDRGGSARASLTLHGARGQRRGRGRRHPGPAAVANAVEDALSAFGVTVRELPITPERVWRWIARDQTS